jgi:hypothetical protein
MLCNALIRPSHTCPSLYKTPSLPSPETHPYFLHLHSSKMSFSAPSTLPARMRQEAISPSAFAGTHSLSCSVLGEVSVQTNSPLASPYNPSLRPLVVRSQLTSLVFLTVISGTSVQPFSYITISYLLLSSTSFLLYCWDAETFGSWMTVEFRGGES